MPTLTKFSLGLIAAFAYSTALVQPVLAHDLDLVAQARGGNPGPPGRGGGGGEDDGGTVTPPELITDPDHYGWMSSDLIAAWEFYQGQGVTITVVDDFNSGNAFSGNLTGDEEANLHGEWTLMQAGMIAPSATMVALDFTTGRRVKLADGFNVLNLSYGMYATAGYSRIIWGSQESSIISYAEKGQAVISKAAGNDAVAVGTATYDGFLDYLARDLIGAQSAIFVGALDGNGSVNDPASLEFYSNYAGIDTDVQAQFLVVGVASGILNQDLNGDGYYDYTGAGTGLAGTSFAAPIISGYAAVLSSKFPLATPTQVASQLLETAHMDYLVDLGSLNSFYYGQGEASISRALSPGIIN